MRILSLESVILTAASVLVAWVITRFVLVQLAELFPMSLSPDLMVLAFVVAIAVGVVLLSGVAPAWRVTARVQVSGLRQNAQSGGVAHARLRNSLIGLQVALSIGLIAITAMSVRTRTLAADRTDTITDGLLVGQLNLTQTGYTAPQATRFADVLLERLSGDARVQLAAISNAGVFDATITQPGVFRLNEQLFGRPGESDSIVRTATVTHATPAWFDILKLRTLAGRLLTNADRGLPVAVVNEALARRLDPASASVVGTPLHLRGFNAGDPPSTMLTVVGVVTDAVPSPKRVRSSPAVYRPLPLSDASALTPGVVIRTSDASSLIPDVRRLIADIAPKAPWMSFETGPEVLARETRGVSILASTIGGLALLALVLATAGLYAVTLCTTSLRTREIGIRVAIGAQQHDVISLILRQALTVVGIGCVAGLILVVPIAFTMRALFVGVSPVDPLSLGPTVAVLLVAALAAAILPALRASRIDPVRALRHE